jgi:heat shock protein HslJ
MATSVLIATSLLFVLAACGSSGGDSAAGGDAAAPPLAGTSWTLVSYADASGAPVEATPSPDSGSLAFDSDGRFSGSTGCNRIAGTYAQDGSSLTMTAGPMTMMACSGAVAVQETAVIDALGKVTSFAADAQLVLKGADGTALLTYDPTLTELAGTSWQATGINNGKEAVVSQAGTESVTAVFGTDGQVSGSGGCNQYSGSFSTGDGNSLAFGPIAATARACADPAIDEIEANYFAALPKVTSYEVEADRLTLRDDTGATQVTYTRMP